MNSPHRIRTLRRVAGFTGSRRGVSATFAPLIVLAIAIAALCPRFALADGTALQCPPANPNEQAGASQCVAPDNASSDPIHLYIPDGQLRSSPVRLFVNRNISMGDKPVLCLYGGHALTPHQAAEDLPQQINYVAPGQSWTENINGQDVTKSGTVLLLNLSRYPIEWYKPMQRVLAVLAWESGGKRLCAVAPAPVDLGNAPTAWVWTIVAGVAMLIVIMALASRGSGRVVDLLCADDGHLSLSLTQIALWTIAVGAVTFFYGLIRFEVPTIPNSVLILMGLSLATAGLGTAAPPQKAPQGGAGAPPPAPATAPGAAAVPAPSASVPAPGVTKASPKLSDLIYLFPTTGSPEPSLSRAQMLFWTALIIVLFVSKSAIDGVLWDVPSGMVALMGFSQAGYVGPKFLGPYAGSR
jgi:hypothetical protein